MSGHHNGKAVLALIQLAASAATNHANQKSAARQAEYEAEIRRCQIDLERERNEIEREYLASKIRIIEGLMNRRMDLVFEAFNFMRGLIEREHASLLDERKSLTRERIGVTDERIIINMQKRLGQITMEMTELRKNGMMLVVEVNHIAQNIGAEFRVPSLMISQQ